MQFLRDLMWNAATTGDQDTVGEVLTACDAVLQRETQADFDFTRGLVLACNRRLRELEAIDVINQLVVASRRSRPVG